MHLGSSESGPAMSEIEAVLGDPSASLMLGLLAVSQHDRPDLLARLLARLSELRSTLGRPHWLLVDEAHHFLPAEAELPDAASASAFPGAIFVTVEPRLLATGVLESINFLIMPGPSAADTIAQYCQITGCEAPPLSRPPGKDDAVFWDRATGDIVIGPAPEPVTEHQRHIRKYAEGNLSDERSFHFRGPENKLKLRAGNLMTFLDLADGVDDATWLFHLGRGEYSAWIRAVIGDDELADEVGAIEGGRAADPVETRALVRAAVERRYTAPAA